MTKQRTGGDNRDLVYKTNPDALVPAPEPDPAFERFLQFADLMGAEVARAVKGETDALRAEIASLRADVEILRGMVGGNVTPIKRERDVA